MQVTIETVIQKHTIRTTTKHSKKHMHFITIDNIHMYVYTESLKSNVSFFFNKKYIHYFMGMSFTGASFQFSQRKEYNLLENGRIFHMSISLGFGVCR